MAQHLKSGQLRWRGKYRLADGTPVTQCFRTRAEAETWERKGKEEVAGGSERDPRAAKQLFGPFGQQWLATRRVEPTTRANDETRYAKHVLGEWAGVPFNRITYLGVQGWVGRLEDSGLNGWTVRSIYGLFHQTIKAAMRERILTVDPCEGVTLPGKPAGREVYLTRDQVDAITDAMYELRPARAPFDAMVLNLAVNTGLRWGELAGLDVAQLGGIEGMRQHKIRVDRVVNEINGRFSAEPRTKNGKDRHVWYPDEISDMLERHLAAYPPERDHLGMLVFRPRYLGGPLGRGPALARGWARLNLKPAVARVFGCTLADKRTLRYTHDECSCGGFTEHDLRHTYASWCLQSGKVTLHELMLLMGHSNYDQTLKYAHLVPDAGAVSRSALERPSRDRRETGTHGRQRPMPGVQHHPETGTP